MYLYMCTVGSQNCEPLPPLVPVSISIWVPKKAKSTIKGIVSQDLTCSENIKDDAYAIYLCRTHSARHDYDIL